VRTTSLEFFGTLKWLDGTPLIDLIEDYRKAIFTEVLDRYEPDGRPKYNMALLGRGKKNAKSLDLILAGLFCLLMRESIQGNLCLLLANDESQAGIDLDLAKKLVACNPLLDAELEVFVGEIKRRDGKGSLKILPAKNVAGAHGLSAIFVGFDEIHAYRDYSLFEALAPDPTRDNSLTWITSYDSIDGQPGQPLYDFKKMGVEGADERMYFSWYSADLCTDPAFANLPSEERANPSIASFTPGYLDQQRRRLPST
jgi:phage terminase large subunit-like protein